MKIYAMCIIIEDCDLSLDEFMELLKETSPEDIDTLHFDLRKGYFPKQIMAYTDDLDNLSQLFDVIKQAVSR